MRRWNGWGDTTQDYPLHEAARSFLAERLGTAEPPWDAAEDDALATVPESRLAAPEFSTDPRQRLLHARGQSFPDWIALRSGQLGPYPDAVALPETHEAVSAALDRAAAAGAVVVPYGGGTSVVGHLDAGYGERPVLSLSLGRMNRLQDLDAGTGLARFGAGTAGPDVEAQLAARGYVLGHYPQSWEYSTIGGWVVTRSSGQQSLRYGRIEQLFDSGRVATPRGDWRVGGPPASSAGPDLREALMGSEGRLGVLTEVTARVRPQPEVDGFHAVFFPDWAQALSAIRGLAQSGLPLSMLRLSNATETDTQLRLADHQKQIVWLRRLLRLRGIGDGMCMLMLGITGTRAEARYAYDGARSLCAAQRGVWIGERIGRGWARNRFRGPYLRNSLWEAGYAVDTCETAVNWDRTTVLMQAMEQAAQTAFAVRNERVHAFTHLSHVYRQGCSIYSTFVFRAAATPDENLERWRALKAGVSEAIVAHGGTISHQHGVGRDHAPYLEAEKGSLGMDLIRAMAREFDPQGLMNPGKLFA